MRITNHLGIPTLLGDINSHLSVVANPSYQVIRHGVTDAIAALVVSVIQAIPVAKEHMIPAVAKVNVRASLTFMLFQPAFDKILVVFRPIDAVRGGRQPDAVHRLRPSVLN